MVGHVEELVPIRIPHQNELAAGSSIREAHVEFLCGYFATATRIIVSDSSSITSIKYESFEVHAVHEVLAAETEWLVAQEDSLDHLDAPQFTSA